MGECKNCPCVFLSGAPNNGEILAIFDRFSNEKTWVDHNFSRSARIEPSFCIVAKLEELNNFYLDCFESYITKNASFDEIPGYLARARARARARAALVKRGAALPPDSINITKILFTRARARCCCVETACMLSHVLAKIAQISRETRSFNSGFHLARGVI